LPVLASSHRRGRWPRGVNKRRTGLHRLHWWPQRAKRTQGRSVRTTAVRVSSARTSCRKRQERDASRTHPQEHRQTRRQRWLSCGRLLALGACTCTLPLPIRSLSGFLSRLLLLPPFSRLCLASFAPSLSALPSRRTAPLAPWGDQVRSSMCVALFFCETSGGGSDSLAALHAGVWAWQEVDRRDVSRVDVGNLLDQYQTLLRCSLLLCARFSMHACPWVRQAA
jgi:hypothetical protein